MNKLLKKILLAHVFVLAGCAQQYGPNSYKLSVNDTGIKVPAPLTAQNISHFYDLPTQTYPVEAPSIEGDA